MKTNSGVDITPLKPGETATFYQNPYFDDVIGIHQSDFPIPTKQTRNKERVKEFKKRVIDMLSDSPKPEWPRKGRLLVMVSISCPQTYIVKVDVDNFLK